MPVELLLLGSVFVAMLAILLVMLLNDVIRRALREDEFARPTVDDEPTGEQAIEWIEQRGQFRLDDWQRSTITALYGIPIVASRAVPDDRMYLLGRNTLVVQLVDPPLVPGEIECRLPHDGSPCARCRAER